MAPRKVIEMDTERDHEHHLDAAPTSVPLRRAFLYQSILTEVREAQVRFPMGEILFQVLMLTRVCIPTLKNLWSQEAMSSLLGSTVGKI